MVVLGWVLFALAVHAESKLAIVRPASMLELWAKDEVTIAVTDDGLGGISVLSEIERTLHRRPIFRKVNLLYFNQEVRSFTLQAIPGLVEDFDVTLESMVRSKADIILVACNTLTVLYPKTKFSKMAGTLTLGVVDFGVDALLGPMIADSGAAALIFGTPITAQSAVHRDALERRGVAAERIVMKGCPMLPDSIEKFGPLSRRTKNLLTKCVHEAWMELADRNLTKVTSVYAGLCCTHFGFAEQLWDAALKDEAGSAMGVIARGAATQCINPNHNMAQSLFDCSADLCPEHESCDISVRVVSKVELGPELKTIAPVVSEPVGNAMRTYAYKPEAFGAHDTAVTASRGWVVVAWLALCALALGVYSMFWTSNH